MKTVYEASSAVEAHMLQDLLRQEDIPAHIQGEFLTGAAGELPAAGLVRLAVEDDHYLRARAAIDRWEAATVGHAPPPPKKPSSRFAPALLGLVAGIAATYAFMRAPATTDGIDFNGDGVVDERWTLSPSGAMLETRVDRNLDGKVDYVIHLDQRGAIESAEADDDFDGRFETHHYYNLGNVERSEVDTDGDTLPNLRSHFKSGVLDSTEYLNPNTGFPLRVEHYSIRGLASAEIDKNNDGKLDQRLIYSTTLEIIRTEPIDLPR